MIINRMLKQIFDSAIQKYLYINTFRYKKCIKIFIYKYNRYKKYIKIFIYKYVLDIFTRNL